MSSLVQLPAPGRGAYDRSLSRAERDAQHRERLMLAAAEVSQGGPATVARIVARAGVGRSTFYEFFDSPEHVLEHIQLRTLRALELAFDGAMTEARTPLERVRAIVRVWLAVLEARPNEARVALERRTDTELLSPASKLLQQALERCVRASRDDGLAWFNVADEVSVLAAVAAIEALSRRHLFGSPLRDAQRVLPELISKLLR